VGSFKCSFNPIHEAVLDARVTTMKEFVEPPR